MREVSRKTRPMKYGKNGDNLHWIAYRRDRAHRFQCGRSLISIIRFRYRCRLCCVPTASYCTVNRPRSLPSTKRSPCENGETLRPRLFDKQSPRRCRKKNYNYRNRGDFFAQSNTPPLGWNGLLIRIIFGLEFIWRHFNEALRLFLFRSAANGRMNVPAQRKLCIYAESYASIIVLTQADHENELISSCVCAGNKNKLHLLLCLAVDHQAIQCFRVTARHNQFNVADARNTYVCNSLASVA